LNTNFKFSFVDPFNYCIDNGIFPNALNYAKILPMHKKNDPLDKGNYRPVSVLPSISKIPAWPFVLFLTTIFNPSLAAFRPDFGCQSTLLRLLEDWRKALDENKHIAAILMDL